MTQGSKGALSSFYGSTVREESFQETSRLWKKAVRLSIAISESSRNKVSNAARVGTVASLGFWTSPHSKLNLFDLMAVT